MRSSIACRALAVLAFLTLLPLASAHIIVPEATNHSAPQQLADSMTQQLVLADLSTPADADVYVFPGKANQTLHVQVLIPKLPGLESFAPSIALFWRRLPDNELQGRQFNSNETAAASTFTDPDTGSVFWQRQGFTAELNADGTYAIVVASETNATGKYAVAVGTVDPKLDPLKLAAAQQRISEWEGAQAPSSPLLAAAIVLIAAGLAVLIIVFARTRKPKHLWQRKR